MVHSTIKNLLNRGLYQKALEHLQESSDPSVSDIEERCLEALLYLLLGSQTECDLILFSVQNISPEDPHYLRTRALYHVRRNESLQEALNMAQAAFKLLPDYRTEIILAECELANNVQDGGIERFKKIIREHPFSAEPCALLASIYKARKDPDNAFAYAFRALQLNPTLSPMWSILGEYYAGHSALIKVITSLEMAHKYDPTNPAYPILLGEYVRMSGNVPRAISILSKVVENAPEDEKKAVAAFVNLGTALHEGGHKEEAVSMYKRALRLNAEMPQIENNLARYYMEQDDEEQSEFHLRKAIELDPSYYQAMNNLSGILSRQGDFENARDYQRKSLKILMTSYPREFLDPKHAPMKVSGGEETMLAAQEALNAMKVPFFLAFGTLLGLVRDGSLLPFDKDLDIGVPWNVPRKKLVTTMKRFGFYPLVPDLKVSDEDEVFNYALVYKKTEIALDFFFFKEEDNTYITGVDSKPVKLKWIFPHFNLQKAKWFDREWLVPSPPEIFFESIYGKNWRVPDPYFDSVVSGLNRSKDSLEIAISSAYGKIFDNMKRSEWNKTIGYCKQLQALRHDPFIDEVISWTQERLNEIKN